MKKDVIMAAMGAPISFIAAYLGGFDTMIKALFIFMLLDYITGILASRVEGKVSSKAGYKGIIKKIGILIVIVIAYQLDVLAIRDMTGMESVARNTVIFFYLGMEGISNLENLGRAGVPLPSFLKNAFLMLKEKGGQQDED